MDTLSHVEKPSSFVSVRLVYQRLQTFTCFHDLLKVCTPEAMFITETLFIIVNFVAVTPGPKIADYLHRITPHF